MTVWKKALIVLSPFVVVGMIVAASYTRYHHDETACEAAGRFYWRGHCLPNECQVIRP